MVFIRRFEQNLLDELKSHALLSEKLRKDIETGEVFPAIRKDEMHFYHKGGRLLAFDKRGFRTNAKYAMGICDDNPLMGDIRERQLDNIQLMKRFSDGYTSMKALCQLYSSKEEAAAVARIYEQWPYTKGGASTNCVVLDIEVSFKAEVHDAEGRRQNRIDLVLFDIQKEELLFIEAKLFVNGAIRAKSPNPPDIVGQFQDYRKPIEVRTQEIISSYGDYVKSVNLLFGIKLLQPCRIIQDMPLLSLGFDKDQRKGRLAKNISVLDKKYNVCCLSIGNADDVTQDTLKSWFTKARKFARARRE